MAQTFEPNDKVVVLNGPDEGRKATVINNYKEVYGDDVMDGAVVRFADGKPSLNPVAGKMTSTREYNSSALKLV